MIRKDGIDIRKILGTEEVDVLRIEVCEEELKLDPSATIENSQKMKYLIEEYVPKKTEKTNVPMKICLTEDKPIYHPPRRLPWAEREIVDKQVEEWVDNGIVEPCSSEYSSQVVVVKKKDGSPRVCIDYRKINTIIVKYRYPLPLIEDQLDKLIGVKIYSTIDLRNGFFHVDIEESSSRCTSFVTHSGQF